MKCIYLRIEAFFHRCSSIHTSFGCRWFHFSSLSFVWCRIVDKASLPLYKLAVSTHQVVCEVTRWRTSISLKLLNKRKMVRWRSSERLQWRRATNGCKRLVLNWPTARCTCTVRTHTTPAAGSTHIPTWTSKIPPLNLYKKKYIKTLQTLYGLNAIYGDVKTQGMIELIHL